MMRGAATTAHRMRYKALLHRSNLRHITQRQESWCDGCREYSSVGFRDLPMHLRQKHLRQSVEIVKASLLARFTIVEAARHIPRPLPLQPQPNLSIVVACNAREGEMHS